MTGLSSYLSLAFKDTVDAKKDNEKNEEGKDFVMPGIRRKVKREEGRKRVVEGIEKRKKGYEGYKGEGDAWKTVFVGGLTPAMTEKLLKWEMESFGKVVRVVLPKSKDGLGVGYGFVEFEKAREAERARREGNGRRIDGMRIVVDVERGRTVKDWLPNRLNGPRNFHVRKKNGVVEEKEVEGGDRERSFDRDQERERDRRRERERPVMGRRPGFAGRRPYIRAR